jgi:hypothetical protein
LPSSWIWPIFGGLIDEVIAVFESVRRANVAGLGLLLVSLLVVSCRTLPERVLEPDDPRSLAVLKKWVEGADARTGLRGRARMAVDSADRSIAVRGKQILVVQRPARLRVEILGFLNQTLAIIVTDGNRFEVLRTQDHSYETGELGPNLLWDEARIALTAEEAISVLLGIPVPDPQWVPMRIAQDPNGLTSIDLADGDGVLRQRVSFDRHGYMIESSRFDPIGQLIWRVRFDDYREIDREWVAHDIELDVTIGATHAEISLSDVELDPPLSEDLFRLRLPDREPQDSEVTEFEAERTGAGSMPR